MSVPELYTELDSLIRIDDEKKTEKKIERTCNKIGKADKSLRDHCVAVRLLHMVLDGNNHKALGNFFNNEIGVYNPSVDSITPLKYFADKNVQKRLARLQEKCGGDGPMYHYTLLFLMRTLKDFEEKGQEADGLDNISGELLINEEETNEEASEDVD